MSSLDEMPHIHLAEDEADWLANMATSLEHKQPKLASLLLREVDRAETYALNNLPPGVVRIGAVVEFFDESNGTSHKLQLVYPKDANFAEGRISVLTPVGVSLIGLTVGSRMSWPDREGRERYLQVRKVSDVTSP